MATSSDDRSVPFMRTGLLVGGAGALLATGLPLVLAPPASATTGVTFTVMNNNDSGSGSLREAIELANQSYGTDNIFFDENLIGTITLLSDLPQITEEVRIRGNATIDGATKFTTISGNGHRVFGFYNLTNGYNSSVEDIVITGAHSANSGIGSAITGIGDVNLLVHNVDISSSSATVEGGAIGVLGSGVLRIEQTTVTGSHSQAGGAVATATNSSYRLNVYIESSTFDNNYSDRVFGGGAVYAENAGGWFSVRNSTFTNNVAQLGSGGAINAKDADIEITASTFVDNEAPLGGGGAARLQGSAGYNVLIWQGSRFLGNRAAGSGGALSIVDTDLDLRDSEFATNTSMSNGGAIDFTTVTGTGMSMSVENSTFASNSTGYAGGAIRAVGDLVASQVNSSTFSGNAAGTGGGALSGFAGGLYMRSSTVVENATTGSGIGGVEIGGTWTSTGNIVAEDGSAVFTETILVGNTSASSPSDIGPVSGASSHTELNHSIVGTRTGTSTNGDGSNQTGVLLSALKLGALADNGGLTRTRSLLPGSVAIDAGYTTQPGYNGDQFDQRGEGFPRKIGLKVDIGAFEVQPAFTPLNPARIVDTRSSCTHPCTVDDNPPTTPSADAYAGIGAIGESGTLRVKVAGRGSVPAHGAGSVVLNVTAVGPSASSFMTVYPSDESRPTASNLNYTSGRTVANTVMAKLSNDGYVTFFNRFGSTNLIVDVLGWYADGGDFQSLSPQRLLDTRTNCTLPCTSDSQFQRGGAIPEGSERDVTIAGRGGVPLTGVEAVVLNVTATRPTNGSFLTVYPKGITRPTASNVNFGAGVSVPNAVIVKLGTDGKITVFNRFGNTDVLVDVAGYYVAGGAFHALDPARVVDTRPTTLTAGITVDHLDEGGAGGDPIADEASRPVCLGGRAGVASAGLVGAVALNVTSTRSSAGGFLTLFPSGITRPNASNVNFAAGASVPNVVIAKVDVNGCFNVFYRNPPDSMNPAAHTDVLVDVAGWFPVVVQ